MYQFILNLNSLQKKFSLTSNYLGPNPIVVKRIDCIVCILTECFLILNHLQILQDLKLGKIFCLNVEYHESELYKLSISIVQVIKQYFVQISCYFETNAKRVCGLFFKQ